MPSESTIIPIAIIVVFLAIVGALALLVYCNHRFNRDDESNYVDLETLLSITSERDDA